MPIATNYDGFFPVIWRGCDVYNRVKRGTVTAVMAVVGGMSQCVQASNVQKNAAQYCSNVLMKWKCKTRRRVKG